MITEDEYDYLLRLKTKTPITNIDISIISSLLRDNLIVINHENKNRKIDYMLTSFGKRAINEYESAQAKNEREIVSIKIASSSKRLSLWALVISAIVGLFTIGHILFDIFC